MIRAHLKQLLAEDPSYGETRYYIDRRNSLSGDPIYWQMQGQSMSFWKALENY